MDAFLELDNPIWSALTGPQASFAEGGALAKRFPPAVTSLAGLAAETPEAFRALAATLKPAEAAVLFLEQAVVPPPECRVIEATRLTQMICEVPFEVAKPAGAPLGPEDLAEMIALTIRTRPGPFDSRTPELGHYLGIRVKGALAAMAGERLRLTGHTEVSAVCTAPEFQGRGYAGALVSQLLARIQARGETPFLHVRSSNQAAIRLYQSLGFVVRRDFELLVIGRSSGSAED